MHLSETERSEIAGALSALVGLPLVDMFRYAGCQKFEFGDPAGGTDWGLVAGDAWRLRGPALDVSSGEFSLGNEDFEPERDDAHAGPFYERLSNAPLRVTGADVGHDGGVRIDLSEGHSLTVGPGTRPADEIWRLMPPSSDPRGQLENAFGKIAWTRTPP